MQIAQTDRNRAPDDDGVLAPRWVAAGCVVAVLGWYAVNLRGSIDLPALGWVPATLSMTVAALGLWRVAATAGLAPGAARFWRQMSGVAALCAVALLLRIEHIVGLSASGAQSAVSANALPVQTHVVSMVAVLLGVWALLRVPVGRLTPNEWVRLLLDSLTIVLGAGLVMWYTTLGPLVVQDGSSVPVWGPLMVAVMCLVGLSAVAKIVLVGAGPVDMGALRLIGVGLLLGGVSAGTASILTESSYVVPGQLSVPVIATLLTVAGHRQSLVARVGPEEPRHPTRRAYSLLPYAALLATDVLLVLAAMEDADPRDAVVVGGAVVVTLVVAFRQLAAFADNARLVRQLRGQEHRLRHQADHDSLTQLANRALFTGELDAALAERPADGLAVLLIDLDDFKSVNDTLGHAVGDQLLLGVAGRLEQCVRPQDRVARLGGDEFGVLLRGVEPHAADAIAAQVLASLAVPVVADEHRLLVRASIGVAVASAGDSSGTLLRNADIAMYAAKERGKGRHLRYVPGMATNVLEHARLGAQLREAIDSGQLYPVFQPVMHMVNRQIIGIETLVRWEHPARGPVPPVRFIPTAERTGLVVPIGRWLLAEACARLAGWKRTFSDGGPFTIGVNVSGRQLAEPTFAADTAATVLDAGLEPSNVVLEVTEDSVLTGGDVIETLRALHDFGIKIALDDFGTGQSSLGLLRSCPVDILKLDKSFVDGIAPGTQQAAIATAVIGMAQALELDAVAEGVEDQRQADFLVNLGYHLGQGFHLAPPMPADEVVRLFAPAGVAVDLLPHSAWPRLRSAGSRVR